MIGKIASLPRPIRDQLNSGLDNADDPKLLLKWLNSLPQVQKLLAEKFHGEPITRQNLYQWRKRGFRKWDLQQTALRFVADLSSDNPGADKPLTSDLTERLTDWAAIRFAALAEAMVATTQKPQTEMRHLRQFAADVVTLRRADLSAGRLHLQHRRLALAQSQTQPELEKLFWEWTKRPDIREKLHPRLDEGRIRRRLDQLIDNHLLGVPIPEDVSEYDTPAALI